jgi:hypothetical protein
MIFLSNTRNEFSPATLKVQVSDPYVTTGRTSVLYSFTLVVLDKMFDLNSWISSH